MLKRVVCSFLALSIAVSAMLCRATDSDGDITIAVAKGIPGSSVTVPITIENNPGIMAITISITYDSSALEYVEFEKGDILKDYMVVAHPAKNIIRFVCCETKDRTGDGRLLSLKFNIAEDAPVGLHEIDINYSSGDFCDWNLKKLMPGITPGGVNVLKPGDTDCSGEIDSGDLVFLRKWILQETDVQMPEHFDVNCDGCADIADLLRIKRYIAGEAVLLGK